MKNKKYNINTIRSDIIYTEKERQASYYNINKIRVSADTKYISETLYH